MAMYNHSVATRLDGTRGAFIIDLTQSPTAYWEGFTGQLDPKDPRFTSEVAEYAPKAGGDKKRSVKMMVRKQAGSATGNLIDTYSDLATNVLKKSPNMEVDFINDDDWNLVEGRVHNLTAQQEARFGDLSGLPEFGDRYEPGTIKGTIDIESIYRDLSSSMSVAVNNNLDLTKTLHSFFGSSSEL